jgi:tetratricopeptide (TPR) repeat protein
MTQPVRGSTVKVAKVDTEYIYEANVMQYLSQFRESRKSRFTNFIGFTPDDILGAREDAIETQIRKEIRRLPGVDIVNSEINELASEQVRDLAWQLYRSITEEGASFENLAREYSAGFSRQGGEMPPFGVVDNPEEYQSRVYTMKPGDVAEPFPSRDGWRIVRLNDVTEDPIAGPLYHVSMIVLAPDNTRAEATIVDRIAANHTIEYLDPKYNARHALLKGDFEQAMTYADEALKRAEDDDLAHYLKARSLWGLGRQDEALVELQRAADTGKVSDALVPYYHYYRGDYLEAMDRKDEALQAYHDSFDSWRQDISLAFILKDAFERVGDDAAAAEVEEEIRIIAEQDALAIALGRRTSGSTGSIIVTGEGETEGSSYVYEPGYQD